ncbi:MAG: hypothetical protein ACKO5P_10285, partial [Nodosilinea sp.]
HLSLEVRTMSLALHFPVNLRMATELLGSDSILFPCTVSGVHHTSIIFYKVSDAPQSPIIKKVLSFVI